MGCMEELSYLWRFPRKGVARRSTVNLFPHWCNGNYGEVCAWGRGARDAVVVPAGGEQGCADIGAIDEMLPWCQVFRAQSLVDGVGTLGLTGYWRWSCARA